MFPTFISILDIQSWWEVPSIAHFCSLFRTAFNLLDFDIEDLEEALLTDGTEESSWLQELIVRLLSGCLSNNEISTFNYQMFLRRLFRQKCQEHDRYNPFNTDIDFQLLPLRTKVDILHALCDFRLDADDVLDQLKNLEADSLRVEPLGYDGNESAYWYFYGTRLYREDFKTKNNKKKSVWQVICFTEDDWFQLTKKFKKSTCKAERQLHHTLSENFLPELPRLFKEKENLARKRLLENFPRRTSSRLRKLEVETGKEVEKPVHEEKDRAEEEENQKKRDLQRKKDLQKKRQEAYERRAKLKEQSEEDSLSEVSESRYEMARSKSKKSKGKQRKNSNSSTSSKDNAVTSKTSKHSKKHEKDKGSVSKTSSSKPTMVGRQTNNSLAAATGQILIQPVTNSNKKKLKTSQVFRQTDEDLQTGMHKILDYVKDHEDAWPFTDPVEEEYAPNYYSIIRKPMDLQRMEERLEAGYYKNFIKFRTDFQLIVDNCRLYNGAENEYTHMVDNLLQVFDKATEKYLDQISSDDDEIAVEFSDKVSDSKQTKKKKEEPPVLPPVTSKRKPMLAAQTDKKRDRSLSEDSLHSKRSDSYESLDKVSVKTVKPKKAEKPENVTKKHTKVTKAKKEKSESKKVKSEAKKEKLDSKKEKNESKKEKSSTKSSAKETKCPKTKKSVKKEKKKSPVRSRSSSRSPSRSPIRSDISSPPPPSWPPSSPDSRFNFSPKENSKKRQSQDHSDSEDSLPKGKHRKRDKSNNTLEGENDVKQEKKVKSDYTPPLSPKPKDKHNKLRETIEKLKAKSEIAKIKSSEYDFELEDLPKENKDRPKKQEKDDKSKFKVKEKSQKIPKKDVELDMDGNSTMDSVHMESKKSKKNPSKNTNPINKNSSTMDALSIATEQTLKDINKWLDDTPKFTEFSSASNSPSYTGLDEFDVIAGKTDPLPGKKTDKMSGIKKEGGVKDFKRRPFRDPAKFFKRREVQRTIDRLQPGKSKGNLITNVPSTNKVDEIFPLGPLSKIKDTKNSLIVKTDTNAPKLSLGSVLDSFGKHKFVDDQKKEEEEKVVVETPKEEILQIVPAADVVEVKDNKDVIKEVTEVKEDNKEKDPPAIEDNSGGGATPNLSAWFKAFGAPKVQPPPKKSETRVGDSKENDKNEDGATKPQDSRKVTVPTASPSLDSPLMTQGQPIPRQRKISTGSSMSERSSFSQDMDSPRVGMDERGAYPAPYPSPLHRSPSGASPIMASPRPDISPKAAAYPTINGQIRVGFYQDTVSNKSSPDKSCSPRENPQSPYAHYSEHVYTPNTTENAYYSYANSPYYTHAPNYSSTNPTPPYNMEATNSSYYDTSKSLTDQYQAKAAQNYTANSPASSHSSPAPLSQHSPNIHSQHSPIMHPQQSPGLHPQQSPGVHSPHSPQHSPDVYQQHSPNVLPQNSPNVHSQNSPHPQLSPNLQCQSSPIVHSQHSQNILPQHSPNIQSQASPLIHPQSPSVDTFQHQEDQGKIGEKVLQHQQSQSAMFPVKKRIYNENDNVQVDPQRFEVDSRLSHREINRNLQMGQQVNLTTMSPQEPPGESKDVPKSYVHQNIPDPKPSSLQTSLDSFSKASTAPPMPQQQLQQMQKEAANMRAMNYPISTSNPYNPPFTGDSNYPLNIPTARTIGTAQHGKIDPSKYTNMGYTGPDANYNRSLQQFIRPELNYTRTTVPPSSVAQKQQQTQVTPNQGVGQSSEMSARYANPTAALQQMGYKGVELNNPTNAQQAHSNFNTSIHPSTRSSEGAAERASQIQEVPSGYKPEVSVPRATYNAPSVDADQPLGLGRNITNLSHIVERFNNDECMIAGLQTSASYYSDKGLGTSHMFNKPISTSASALPMFSQANMAAMQSYNQNVQGTATTMYNRQMTELQNPGIMPSEAKTSQQPPATQEKKIKKRKSSKSVTPVNSTESQQPNATNQGFQSYAGLKGNSSIEPSAISLKTSSVVPGSAFNFGPTPTSLSIGSGLYDKDAYPNYLEEFRSAPNYYMAAAAAAHHRSTPETGEKQTRAAHQNSNPQAAPSYPFLGAPQARPTYPIGGPFIPNAQAQLMDTSSPLYQHYLQAGVLNQGLLGPPGAYPPGYHPALSMRQPYDSMPRPSWL